MRKFFNLFFILLVLAQVLLAFFIWRNLRDRHPDYELDLSLESPGSGSLSAGFSAVPITPQVVDGWTDVNQDAQFDPEGGDRFEDRNGNGEFDPVWLAGFQNARPAQGVHDDLWARCMILDDSSIRLGVASLDLIGLFHDDVVDIRERVAEEVELDYLIVTTTHNHEGPDTLGLWGESFWSSGVDTDYLEEVKTRTAAAVVEAVEDLQPVRLRVTELLEEPLDLVRDTRLPEVMDSGLRVIQAVDRERGVTLGTLLAWGNHPETLWRGNLQITSDFPHFFRQGVEEGVKVGEKELAGLGGVALYVNGAIGGLMTTDPSLAVTDPASGKSYREPTFAKARAQGRSLAGMVLEALSRDELYEIEEGRFRIRAKTVDLPLENRLYQFGTALGVIDRGMSGWLKLRTEVSAWRLGELSFVTFPGEVYPEIVQGGVVNPPGADFQIDAVEDPPIRKLMPGRFRFVLGLANDEIGYIIPKSEWDEDPPYLYGAESSPYGEINSVGPQTGPILYQQLRTLLEDLKP